MNTTTEIVRVTVFSVPSVVSDQAALALRDVAERLRGEATVLQWEAHRAWNLPNRFFIYEHYQSEAALASFDTGPDAEAVRTLTAQASGGPVDRSVWRPFDHDVRQAIPPGHATLVAFRMRHEDIAPMAAEIRQDSAMAKGLVRFDLNQGNDDAGRFLICARWRDRAAWEQHQVDAAHQSFGVRTARFYDGPRDRTLWRPER